MWREIVGLREEQVRLREDFNRMLGRIEKMDERLDMVLRATSKPLSSSSR